MNDRMSRRRILLVDDDTVILNALGYGLRQAGYVVQTCSDAADAAAAYQGEPPDLAIIDIGLPDMRGTDLAEKLMHHRYRPILILSSHSEREWVDQAIDCGVIGYLVKPLSAEQLIPSVETALARFGEIERRVAEKFGASGISERQLTVAMDQFSFGIIIVDEDHQIILSNRLARRYLSSGKAITNQRGKLRARCANSQFMRMLDRSLGKQGRSSPGMISLRNDGSNTEIQAWSTPLPGGDDEAPRSAFVVVNDPSLTAVAPLGLLKTLFGMTKKESALAHALVNGLSIDEYCAQAFVTRNTARTHLRAIYRKTSTHRQVDLVRLLSRLFIKPPDD